MKTARMTEATVNPNESLFKYASLVTKNREINANPIARTADPMAEASNSHFVGHSKGLVNFFIGVMIAETQNPPPPASLARFENRE